LGILACGLKSTCEDLINIIPKFGIDLAVVRKELWDTGIQFHSGDVQVIINESPIKGSDENGRVSQIVSVAVLIVDPTCFHSCPKTCFVCSLLLVFLGRPGVFLYSGQCESEWPVLCFRFKWASQASQGFLSYSCIFHLTFGYGCMKNHRYPSKASESLSHMVVWPSIWISYARRCFLKLGPNGPGCSKWLSVGAQTVAFRRLTHRLEL